MNRTLCTRWPARLLLLAGIACTAAACAQSGWRGGPGPGWGRGGGPGWDRGPFDGGYYGMGPGMMGPGMMGPRWGWNMPAYDEFDRNGDGRVSQSEFDAARAERRNQRAAQGYPMRGAAYAPSFSDIDADDDGNISADELNNYHDARRQAWTDSR